MALLACCLASACGKKSGTSSAPSEELPETCAPLVIRASTLTLDDFEDGNEQLGSSAGLHGAWYRENDGTGVQTDLLVDSPGARGSDAYALHTSGGGFRQWGAFVAVRLNEAKHAVCTVDVSALHGLALMARGQGGVRVNFGTPATTPRGDGGECDAEACSDYGRALVLTEDWQRFELDFDSLSQPDWAAGAEWEPQRLLRMSFWAEQGDFDIWLDDLSFY